MNKTDLHKKLYSLQDLKYRDMQIRIIPTVDPKSIIGVRTPELRAIAKEMLKEGIIRISSRRFPMGILKKTSCMLLSFPGSRIWMFV